MGVSPQPARTVLSVSAQILLTLQTPFLLLPLSTLGAQVPERDKERCMIYPEVRNAGCPTGQIFSNIISLIPEDFVIKSKSESYLKKKTSSILLLTTGLRHFAK